MATKIQYGHQNVLFTGISSFMVIVEAPKSGIFMKIKVVVLQMSVNVITQDSKQFIKFYLSIIRNNIFKLNYSTTPYIAILLQTTSAISNVFI